VISKADLQGLLAEIWPRTDPSPESTIGAAASVELFHAAGPPLVVPTNQPEPPLPLTIYRGATEARQRGMAWTTLRSTAESFRDGRIRRQPGMAAFVYRTTVDHDAVLAVFNTRPPEAEIVVDPLILGDIECLESPGSI
jgi:hypothetical protein